MSWLKCPKERIKARIAIHDLVSFLDQPPTSTAVVRKTLERSKKMMQERGKDQIAVFCDLAIAKMTL